MSLKAINPTNGQLIKEYPQISIEEAEKKILLTHKAQQVWRNTSLEKRALKLKKFADLMQKRKEELGKLAALEMGKTMKEGRSESEKCSWVLNYYAENGEKFLSDEQIKTEAQQSFVCFEPMGVVLAIMPWNFPFWQVFRFLAPALMAGNGALLKHASNVPGCAKIIEDIFLEVGFPENLFQNLPIPGAALKPLFSHPLIAALTLTGSTPVGQKVAGEAGLHLKKCVLELGGSDPYIILEDADLQKAAKACVAGRMINAGQSCVAAKRFIVIESVKLQFEKYVLDEMRKIKMGDPFDKSTDIGPLARHDLRDELHAQVEESIKQGAVLLFGGKIPEGPGAFYPPTLLSEVKKGIKAYEEELFGPVASIITVKDAKEAVMVANDTPFGLGSAIFSKNIDMAIKYAREIDCGVTFINDFVKSDPRLPFGGVKESGYGRELSSYGMKEFVNIKTISVKKE